MDEETVMAIRLECLRLAEGDVDKAREFYKFLGGDNLVILDE